MSQDSPDNGAVQRAHERPDLISPEYQSEMRQLVQGGKGDRWAPFWRCFIKLEADADPPRNYFNLLDYGCGQGSLARALMHMGDRLYVRNYDPGQVNWDRVPNAPFQLINCTDVLEHIEPDLLDNVLAHIKSLVAENGRVLFAIGLTHSNKQLSNGRNAHTIVESETWWAIKLRDAGFRYVEHVEHDKPQKTFAALWRLADAPG